MHPNSADRRRPALLLPAPGALRARRQHRPAAHPAPPRALLFQPQAQWPLLCARSDDLLSGQTSLLAEGPPAGTRGAQRSAVPRVARRAPGPGTAAGPPAAQRVAALGPPPQRRGGAGRPRGVGATGSAGPAGRLGRPPRVAHGGGGPSASAGPSRRRSARRAAGCQHTAASGSCSAAPTRRSA